MVRHKVVAKTFGISEGHYSNIYNGKRKPSLTLALTIQKWTGHTFMWWRTATITQIQNCLDRVATAIDPRKGMRK